MVNTFNAFPQNKFYDYAYMSKTSIYVYSTIEKKQYFVANDGSDPRISPNGQKLAYTRYSGDGSRFINLIDLNTKVKTTLNTHSNNCYGPVWSPDGKFLAYNVILGNVWCVAINNLSNSKITVLENKGKDNFSPIWLSSGKNIAVQNMEKILVYDLSGKVVSTYNDKDLIGGLSELSDGVGHSSSDQFVFSNDNKKIIFNTDLIDPTVKSDDGLTPAIFIYDIGSKKTLRLSPTGYSAFRPVMTGELILFNAEKGSSAKTRSIYSIDMNGKNLKLLFANCRDISAKN